VIDTVNLKDLNRDVPAIRKQVAEQALTVLNLQPDFLPLKGTSEKGQNKTESNTQGGVLYSSRHR
jgi:hypothetical protein